MKRFFSRSISWWFVIMVPASAPQTTIDARETLRKRRLFSGILLVSFTLIFLFTVQTFFVRVSGIQLVLTLTGCGEMLLALWINQRGHLKSASVFHFSYMFLGMAVTITSLSSPLPSLSLILWVMLLPLSVASGLFLPAWGPLSLGSAEIVFMNWFVLSARQSQINASLGTPAARTQFLFFACLIIASVAIFSAIYATTTKKAVIQADRAIELEQTHQALSEAYAIIQKQALTDVLTGLPNHRALMDQLEQDLEGARRYNRPFSLLFFDADHFKHVNDSYGHVAGDTVLHQIGEWANSVLRRGDTLGRFGGEEFVILLPEADAQEAATVAERIRARIAALPIAFSGVQGGIAMTVSMGLATYRLDGACEQELLSQADEAMYVAKRMGRNQVRTAQEARQMSRDVELMARFQQEEQHEVALRSG